MPGRERLPGRRVRCHRQCQQQPLDRDIAVAGFLGEVLGRLDKALRPLGVFFELHGYASCEPAAAPPEAATAAFHPSYGATQIPLNPRLENPFFIIIIAIYRRFILTNAAEYASTYNPDSRPHRARRVG